jgi:hypothetical protein
MNQLDEYNDALKENFKLKRCLSIAKAEIEKAKSVIHKQKQKEVNEIIQRIRKQEFMDTNN